MYNLIDDLLKFVQIPKKKLQSLAKKSELDIANCIKESYDTDSDCQIDIGIGTLIAEICGNDIIFKFIPSDDLSEYIRDSITDEKSTLLKVLEDSCSERTMRAYKELF